MEGTHRKRGSVETVRDKLVYRLWWRHPDDPYREHRWTVSTHQTATDENRSRLRQNLEVLNAKIQAGAFFPCQEFPGTKIAAYCHCGTCAAVEPLSQAHQAPSTLGDLFKLYKPYEEARATGDRRVIEASSWRTKKRGMDAMEKTFTWLDESGLLCDVSPLTDYQIKELMPDAVKDWLSAFQHRQELLTEGKGPASTKYMINLLSTIRQALKYGQLRRWWRSHPLLEFSGTLIETTKEERHRRNNRTLNKPFSIVERDRIIQWFERQWHQCSAKHYRGKEKIRLLFLLHYVVIGFNTGLRSPSEMTALEWADVDYSNQCINIRKSRESSGRIDEQIIRPYTKTVRHRSVPINNMVLESLRALEKFRQTDHDWIFWNPRASTSNPLAISNGWAPLTGEKRIRYQFEECLKALNIPSPENQGQYRMRHTFTTLALDNTDLSDEKVAALIGDNVETMRSHYQGHCRNRWRDDGDVDQLNRLNGLGKGVLRAVQSG
ncbi:tyrosine-type recombinase/integrase [Parahaliea mediterranea]|uniref:Site-specific integrase n=1 Tax=Parahaliea mediterranea TaxID=651086 RepID=A0A939DDL4_9GAMM|nr:site-specific integrase [Parahaliea mediterranea]MBN7795941.1 site-specific integrase [Parahaliea mediterranea]